MNQFTHKTWRRAIALIAVMSVVLCFAACGSKEPAPAATETTTAMIEQPAVKPEAEGTLSWSMDASAWSSSNGATVTLSVTPAAHADSDSAVFVVALDGVSVEEVPCQWNGSAFTAEVDLEAADGYCYTCVLTGADGVQEIVLSDPDNLTYDALVYMKNSLTAYCNLIVADWAENDGKLDITSGYVQVQLPQIQPKDGAVEFKSANLVLLLNGNQVSSQALELPQGEGRGSYETALTSVSFDIPEMEDDYSLELRMEVALSDGQTLSVEGCSWIFNNGKLGMPTAG